MPNPFQNISLKAAAAYEVIFHHPELFADEAGKAKIERSIAISALAEGILEKFSENHDLHFLSELDSNASLKQIFEIIKDNPQSKKLVKEKIQAADSANEREIIKRVNFITLLRQVEGRGSIGCVNEQQNIALAYKKRSNFRAILSALE